MYLTTEGTNQVKINGTLPEELTQLTALESIKFEGNLSALFELTELVYIAHKKGKIDDEYIAAWELRTKAAMSVARIRTFWSKTKLGYRKSFSLYIDGLMET